MKVESMKRITVLLAFLSLTGSAQILKADDSASSVSALPTLNRAITLNDAVSLAAKNNLTLKQSVADLEEASAMARSASAQTKASVATTTYALVGDSNNIVASSPGVLPQNDFGTPTRGVLDQNIIAMLPLFTGGKIAGQVHSAEENRSAASFQQDQTLLTVKNTAAQAYVKAELQGALVDAAQSRVTAEDEQVRITQVKVTTGRLAPVDLLREQAERANAEQGLLSAQNDSSIACVDLKVALGVSQASQLTLLDHLDSVQVSSVPTPSMNDAIRMGQTMRPDIAAADEQIKSAEAALKAAKGAYAPQVYALGMVDGLAGSVGSSRVGYTVGLTASLPLYEGGQRHADTDAAIARVNRKKADAQVVRQTADQEIATAWLNLETATQQIDTAATELNAAQKGYDLANLRFNAGKSVAAERLDALSALTRARADSATASANLIDSRLRLQTAMGIQL